MRGRRVSVRRATRWRRSAPCSVSRMARSASSRRSIPLPTAAHVRTASPVAQSSIPRSSDDEQRSRCSARRDRPCRIESRLFWCPCCWRYLVATMKSTAAAARRPPRFASTCARAQRCRTARTTPRAAVNKCVSVRDDSPARLRQRAGRILTHCALRANLTCDAKRESEASGCQALQDASTRCYVGGASHADAGGPSSPSAQDGGVPTTSTSTPAVRRRPTAASPRRPTRACLLAATPERRHRATPAPRHSATQCGRSSDAGAATRRHRQTRVDSGVLGALLCAPEPERRGRADSCLKTGCCTEIEDCGADYVAIGIASREPSCVTNAVLYPPATPPRPTAPRSFDALDRVPCLELRRGVCRLAESSTTDRAIVEASSS